MGIRRIVPGRCLTVLFLLQAGKLLGAEPSPVPLLEARGVRPEAMVERLIDLFEGSRAAHPAAALAAWKHATRGTADLGKPVEAMIAALNPAMVPEFQALDGADLRVAIDPRGGQLPWRLALPRDDGRFGGLARALALTEGAILEPVDGHPIFRIGGEGTPVAKGPPGAFAIASDLGTLLATPPDPDTPFGRVETLPGWYVHLDPRALRLIEEPRLKQVGEGLAALGVQEASGGLGLDGGTLSLDLASRLDPALAADQAAIDPAWLDAMPPGERLAVIALAWPQGKPAVDRLFDAADHVERADPARGDVAPIRVRLNVLALAARVNLETDLWPHLAGLSLGVEFDTNGQAKSGLLGLHARSPENARRIFDRLVPGLAAKLLGTKPDEISPATLQVGLLQGKPILAASRGPTLWLAWGEESLSNGPDAPPRPRSNGISRHLGPDPLRRFGLLRPGALATAGTPLAIALDAAPPIVWRGRSDGATAHDRIRWEGLRGTIHRGLDALPQETPQDRSSR